MSFNIGLSGMRAASKDLNVTGNNIANAGTVGFKQSRAEFADVYASSMGVASNTVGSGVRLSNVSQQFTQGNVSYTQNALDLAINGTGFFQVSNNGAMSYTRAGYFGTDREGFLVDNFGNNLQGKTIENEQLGKVGNLRIDTANQEPRATSKMEQAFNLNSTNVTPPNTPFSATDPGSYNSSTSTNIYDAQGNAHVMTQYFVKSSPNHWDMNVLIDGAHPMAGRVNSEALTLASATPPPTPEFLLTTVSALGGLPDDLSAAIADIDNSLSLDEVVGAINRVTAGTPSVVSLEFDASGKLLRIGGDGVYDELAVPPVAQDTQLWQLEEDRTLTLFRESWTPAQVDPNTGVLMANGAKASTDGIRLDIRSATQYASAFGVNSVSQDGYTTGQLAGLEINETGSIFARYTNGQSKLQGQVELVGFANEQGLKPVGNNQWVQSFESGEPVPNAPGSGTLGLLEAGALEDSNVELSDQLVNLIVAQRNYQANAKTIETESAITQTIINLR